MTPFDVQYKEAIRQILDEGIDIPNPWSGRITRMIPGLTLRVDVGESFPLLTLRKIPLKLFIAEQIWYLMGENNPTWLQQFTRIWDDFLEEDGTVQAAYGYRWRHHFGRDQMESLVNHLAENPASRHAVVVTWDPSGDGLGVDSKKNLPCPYTFTVNIAGGRLHLHNIIRSNDMMLGCPHDAAGFALLQCILAERLGLKPGIYTHSISNAHIYDNHFEAAREIIGREHTHAPIALQVPVGSYGRAVAGDSQLVEELFVSLNSQYQPLEPIKGMKITVNVY
ncbi:MAG: Thymidylate synthase [Candidatus Uhrbacteria bacterium GW2011_GWA2_52_8d]|uniref:thymidylate synthase n=1 Tax=Candidatus Uhrbacteria bacterium GW2011_GWA2_52_8d TaxID=1618979 RepID=A0A0G1ZSL5_9BACT|nr:MAG: Thymidylate synthase [Candidatus Uhrbacteria bacterium GW2011_GWA2_52_8d]